MIDRAYAELDVVSNFSFLHGASHPEELVKRAALLKLYALGIADENTLAGVVRTHIAAKHEKIKIIVGARLVFSDDTPTLIAYPINLQGYQSLSRMLSRGKLRAKKGLCELFVDDIEDLTTNIIIIATPNSIIDDNFLAKLHQLKNKFNDTFYCSINFTYDGFSDEKIAILQERASTIPFVVTNSVIAHDCERRSLADVLACIKAGTSLAAAQGIIQKNSERYIKPPEEMWRLFYHLEEGLKNSIRIAQRINFSLDELRYQYPSFSHDSGLSDNDFLQQETYSGARRRYKNAIPKKVQKLLDDELAIVRDLGYATYFLTVYDIVNFAKSKGILCQGRGSAANSSICYCLGITEVDPNTHDLLFGRFISKERNEPPDIDVDFENGEREEVMQYIFDKYGRNHAAITATVITYKKRMAVREVAKVFGLSLDAIDALMRALNGLSLSDIVEKNYFHQIAVELGYPETSIVIEQILTMAHLMRGFPRHLGQHVGGFVINQDALTELVPIGNAAMPNRSFIEWDKNDLDAMGILKVDILALGMLSAIKRCFLLVKKHYGRELSLDMRRDDKNVYDMLTKADSIGVFQVESRAQMSMLPRLRPKVFYDLVIEVAIIRPGPIQGDMVHPYLRRRNGIEKITYPSEALKAVLQKTLGIPLFQEQVMQVAIIGAGFTPGEADALRRSLAAYRRLGKLGHFYDRFIEGMLGNGYKKDFAERVFQQILGFAEYGFPESHAASFANLVYVSAWLKYYYPEAFTAALLNSQPMGFYGPSQLLADAQRHDVKVLPIDINKSFIDNTIENVDGKICLRLGFQEIRGLVDDDMAFIIACRPKRGFTSITDIFQKTNVSKKILRRLNKANAFFSLGVDERQAAWEILGLYDKPPSLLAKMQKEDDITIHFTKITDFERMKLDYQYTGFSLKLHPLAFVREKLTTRGYSSAKDINDHRHGMVIKVAGLIVIRQRPATAKGIIFFTLEDETGLMNIVLWPNFALSHRKEVLLSTAVAIKGRLEKKDGVHHIIADDIKDIGNIFANLPTKVRNFH